MSATEWENETPYQVLGLDQGPQSTLEDIKKAYRYVFRIFNILQNLYMLPEVGSTHARTHKCACRLSSLRFVHSQCAGISSVCSIYDALCFFCYAGN